MLKVFLFVLFAAVAEYNIALAYTLDTRDTGDNIVDGCLYQNEMWGSLDGTKFYICLPGTDTAIEFDCPEGTFFVKNATVSGCVNFAAVDPACVYQGAVEACTGENLTQPQPAADPTQFYLCKSEGATPTILTCPDQKAFLSQDGYLGCFDWAKWREVRGCTE